MALFKGLIQEEGVIKELAAFDELIRANKESTFRGLMYSLHHIKSMLEQLYTETSPVRDSPLLAGATINRFFDFFDSLFSQGDGLALDFNVSTQSPLSLCGCARVLM